VSERDRKRRGSAPRAQRRAGEAGAAAREPLSRERIITAALELIGDDGLEGLTMRALGRRLGVEAMALYHYFPNKTALMEAMATAAEDVEQVFGRFFAGMDFTGMDAGERIVAIGLRYIEFAQTHPAHFELLFHVLPLEDPTWEDFVTGTSTFRIPQGLVQAGIDEGAFTERPGYGVNEMAYSLWAFVHGLAVLRKTRLRDLEADFDALNTAALQGLVRAFEA
jgi:AcrR family transcriptional regulator